MRLVCVSDTHGLIPEHAVPEGDVLLHAGDLTTRGSLEEIERAHAWLASLPHAQKILIAGNHDWAFEREPAAARRLVRDVTYLQYAETVIEGVRFWGSPWQPWFCDWAFNLERGAEIGAKWSLIPAGIDVLITHGPPAGHGDRTFRGEAVGCEDLLQAVARVQPALHVFGHIHEGHGMTTNGTTTFLNASICDVRYRPVHPPLVFDVVR